jgi:hypothetical protein
MLAHQQIGYHWWSVLKDLNLVELTEYAVANFQEGNGIGKSCI